MEYFTPGKKIIYSTKGMMASKFEKSPAMKEMMAKDPLLAKIFKNPRRRREFYAGIKGKGSITRDELREVLGKLRIGTDDAFNKQSISILGKELIKYGKRYITPKGEEDDEDEEKNNIRKKIKNMEEKDKKVIQGASKKEKGKSERKSARTSGGSSYHLANPTMSGENKFSPSEGIPKGTDKSKGNKARNVWQALRQVERNDN